MGTAVNAPSITNDILYWVKDGRLSSPWRK